MPQLDPNETILILAPVGKDAQLAADLLTRSGLPNHVCDDISDLCEKIRAGAGVVLITEEALITKECQLLLNVLQNQPTWSDIPVILLTSSGLTITQKVHSLLDVFSHSSNVTHLERPLRWMTLLSAIQTALRSRRRQYEIRSLLEEREKGEARKRAILEAAVDAVITIDSQHRIVEWNSAAELMIGISGENAQGQDLGKLLFGNTSAHDTWLNLMRAVNGSGNTYSSHQMEAMALRANHSPLWVEMTVVRVPVEQTPLFTAFVRDISIRKRAEDMDHFLTDLADQMRPLTHCRDVTWVATQGIGKFFKASHCIFADVDAHQGMLRIKVTYSRTKKTMKGCFRLERFPCNLRTQLRLGFPVWVSDVARAPEFKDLTDIFVRAGIRSFGAIPLMDNDKWVGIVAVLFDTSQSLTPEEERVFQMAVERSWMEIQNARLYESEQAARTIAENAVKSKDQFLAVLSHELRTPLTPVLMTLSALQRRNGLPEPVYNALEVIRRNVQLEARLVDDLLDLSRITHKKVSLQLERLDLHQILRRVVDICQSDIMAKGLTYTLLLQAQETTVEGDALRLQQVFWNLVKNAVKFTPSGGYFSIHTENLNEKIRVRVLDSGIGIPSDKIERIFEAFEQVHSSHPGRYGGLGLGLAISKATVEAHGGQLRAYSAGPNEGSEFQVDLQFLPQGARSFSATLFGVRSYELEKNETY